jgi:hypothetical protein
MCRDCPTNESQGELKGLQNLFSFFSSLRKTNKADFSFSVIQYCIVISGPKYIIKKLSSAGPNTISKLKLQGHHFRNKVTHPVTFNATVV